MDANKKENEFVYRFGLNEDKHCKSLPSEAHKDENLYEKTIMAFLSEIFKYIHVIDSDGKVVEARKIRFEYNNQEYELFSKH